VNIKNISKLKIVLLIMLLLTSCSTNKNTSESTLKKQIKFYQKLDNKTIKKVFHVSEIDGLKRDIKEKCKLLDIEVNSFFVSNPQQKLISLSIQKFKMDINCKYDDISSFLKFLKSYKKFIGISEFIIDSKQTGSHRVYIAIEMITKDYIDTQYIPKAIKLVAGLSIDNLDYLKACVKVYKTRHYFVNTIINREAPNWNNVIKSFVQIPEKAYIKQLHYYRTTNSEQIKLIVHLLILDQVINSTNLFFKNHLLSNYFNKFSKKKRPIQIDGTKIASTTYLYQK